MYVPHTSPFFYQLFLDSFVGDVLFWFFVSLAITFFNLALGGCPAGSHLFATLAGSVALDARRAFCFFCVFLVFFLWRVFDPLPRAR